MPHHYTATLEVAHPLPELFAYLTQPKHLTQLTPADLNLELVTAPEVLTLGSRLVWKGRRWGISQQITQEVVAFEVEKLIIMEQKQGPLARWVYASQFSAIEKGTRIVEKIDYDPPGGLLGFIVTADSLRRDFDKLLAYREKKLKEIFG
ncbi:MAG: SRPBCC family protein [Planctomycetes bacterium]|nr:SRPBCC family protein [Planctomycetota bacterium]